MGLLPSLAIGIGAVIVALGGFRGVRFVTNMITYRERTKADTIAAPPDFLRLGSGPSRPLTFFRINDEVMGGRSTSVLRRGEGGGVAFTGEINTNGGGFASFRTLGDDEPLGLTPKTRSLLVDATGDGQLHKAMLHTTDSWNMRTPSWSQDFVAHEKRTTHRLPLRDFLPSRQGRLVSGSPPLDPAEVTGIGFSLSLYTADGKPNPRFGPGPFQLHVHGVRVEEA